MKKRTRKLLVWIMLILMVGSVIATMLGYMITSR
ncbi:MAG: DUF4044 domain-containing protein [Bacilli bacterium]|nr:DUF4044 domain-containing protein [Bacilli bacterium]